MAFYSIFSAETKFVKVCHNVSSPVGRSGAGGFLSLAISIFGLTEFSQMTDGLSYKGK